MPPIVGRSQAFCTMWNMEPRASGYSRAVRLPDEAYRSQPWRIHELATDFELEDVWNLPTPGGPDDLERVVRWFTNDEGELSYLNRVLFTIRWKIGDLLGWDREEAGVGTRVNSLRERLPEDLLNGPRGPDASTVPLQTVYQTETEWVAEICNRTVHALMHIGWVSDEANGYHAQMAVLVKPNGRVGRIYMAAILPVRRWIVYPALLRTIGREWQGQNPG